MLVEEELEKFSRKSNSENNVTETAVGKIGENINSLKEESAKKNENIKKLRDESAKKNESVKDLEKSLKELEEESAKKNENIKKLRDGIYSLTDILKKYKLDITKKYFTSIINILENKFSIKSLKGDISRKEDILKLLDNIKNNKIEDEELKKELEGLKNANTNIYNNIIAYFNKFKVHIDSFEGYE
jgi:chromosome segregation ATPase